MRMLLLAVACACSAPPKPIQPRPSPLRPVPIAEPRPVREALAYLDGTIITLAHKYVDPNRFEFRKMLRGALDGMEQQIAEVIGESADDKVTIRVNQEQRTFAGDVDSLAELGIRLTEIIWFVQQHASPHTERREVELHAVNGMLRTLDPHTFVISAKEMEEWNVNLSGKFGGLGIQIHMPADRVAVQKVYANTPAEKGGIQVGDQILAINGQSTEALTLDETMERLRGDPGSSVKLSLERAGKPLALPLTRAEIKIPVVESRMLAGQVGYVSLERFDAETARELERAMVTLRDAGAKAWVVDLRDNEGGYLTQAVKAADLFVEYGTIVATVAGGKKHDIKNATSGGVDTRRPVVVLIGENTASAAEILAGALKQLDRAVVVGRRSFGKGSVQVLEDAAHEAKLKITTAEYVATNDISPQGGGIQPDLELVPARIPKQITDKTPVQLVPEPAFRERDLGGHLETTQKQDTTKPVATIRYHRPESDEPLPPDQDYEVLLARDVALAGNARTRHEALKQLPKLVAKALPAAERGIADAFKPLGIDWTRGKLGGAKLALRFEPQVTAKTGDVVTLRGEITNTGTTTAFRVHAHAKSDDPTLDGTELAFGKLAPRETKQAIAMIKLPRGSAQRVSTITWTLDSGETATTTLAIAGTPFPEFAITAELADGNDGVVRAGETIRVRTRVTNRGLGRSAKTIVTLKSLTGERLIVDRGRVEVGLLEPNQHRDVELVFATAVKLDLAKLAVEVGVTDAQLDTGSRQRIELVVGQAPPRLSLTPPRIRVDDVALETTNERITVSGTAVDDQVVGDVYISVSNRGAKVEERKVFYAAGKQPMLAFSSEVPLAKGVNRIIVTAREHDKSHSVRTLWVLRR